MVRAPSVSKTPPPAGSRRLAVRQAFAIRDFRLLCFGETVSLVGDQFYLLAMPWLALKTTGSPLVVGLVSAVLAIPRALLMLPAGALSDRLSPRAILLVSNAIRMVLVAVLAGLAMGQALETWMLFVFAISFGSADAFYFPARGALVPRLLPKNTLLIGNATMQAGNQLAMFIGPLLAGNVIAFLGNMHGGGAGGEAWGIGGAFAVDAVAFLISLMLLAAMRAGGAIPVVGKERPLSLWASVIEGIRAVQSDAFLRTTFTLIGAGNLLVTGPLYVGVPVLVDTRYGGRAEDLGLILALFGAGSLAGVGFAAIGHRISERNFFRVMASCSVVLGGGLIVLGTAHSLERVAAMSVLMGLAQGYLVVQFLTVLQQRTSEQMLGRIMSLLMFLVVGLSPLSSGLAGALMELDVSRLLVLAGGSFILLVGGSFFSPALRQWGGDARPSDRP